MIMTGTRENCGGGKTYWGTWISCEEFDIGQGWLVCLFQFVDLYHGSLSHVDSVFGSSRS